MQDEIPESRRRIMRAIKGKDTKSEVLLAKRLWHKGYRYRKHDKEVFGTPDLTFRKYRVVIFVDGEFFHGKDWDQLKERLRTRKEFWTAKIERNMERDRKVNEYLVSKGWKVMRFWSDDIRSNVTKVVAEIENELLYLKRIIDYKQEL